MKDRFNRGVQSLTVVACLVLGIAATAKPLAAQLTTASISGTVKDQSGAVLPGATVTATE